MGTKTTKYVTTKGLKDYLRELKNYIVNDHNVVTYDMYSEIRYITNLIVIESDGSVACCDKSIEDLYEMVESECRKYFSYVVPENSAIFDINTGLFKYDHLEGGSVGMFCVTQDVFGRDIKFLVKHDFSNCEDSLVFFTFDNVHYTFTLNLSEMRLEHPFVRLRESLMENVVNIQVEDKNYLFL